MNNRGTLIVVSGPSGVGKGTIVHNYLCQNNDVALSVSATTRNPRQGEVDGVHYHFISKDKFENLINSGGLLEYAQYGSNYYGTLKTAVNECVNRGQDIILEIECQGAMQIKNVCPEALFIFIMPPSMAELHRRLEGRATESEENIQTRLRTAIGEMAVAYEYDYVIFNNEVDDSVKKFESIVKAYKCSSVVMKEYIDEINNEAKLRTHN